jgi:hypothetical protein
VRPKLVKRLAQKLRTGKTEMHPFFVAAGLRHRRDPAVALHLVGVPVMLPARASARQSVQSERMLPALRILGSRADVA